MYLLDTNVVSELRKRRGDPGVKKWVADQSAADLAVSVVTIIEIEIWILRKQRTDPDRAPHSHPVVRKQRAHGLR
jgi:toxin FitB